MYAFWRPGVRAAKAFFKAGFLFNLLWNSSGILSFGSFLTSAFTPASSSFNGLINIGFQDGFPLDNFLNAGEPDLATYPRVLPGFDQDAIGIF